MKLLQVNNYYQVIGGVESYLADVSHLLKEAGVQVAVMYGVATGAVSGRSSSVACEKVFTSDQRLATSDKQPIEVIHCPQLQAGSGSNRERFRRIREIVERAAPDVVLVHHIEEADVLRVLSDLRPTFQFVHVQSRFFCPGRGKFYARRQEVCRRPFSPYCLIAPYLHLCGTRRPWRIAANYLITSRWIEAARQLRGLIVASEYMKRELIAIGIPEAKITVNPLFSERKNVVCRRSLVVSEETRTNDHRQTINDIAAVASDQRPATSDLPASGECPLVLFCGRMYDYKGAEFLLRALDDLTVPVRAVFIGDGPELPKLKQRATLSPARHAIEFTGWLNREAVHEFYHRASVVVVPSLWPEPFCRVGIEALAYGKPVVAFAVGGIPEWLHDGYNGFLAEPKNTRQLTTALESILTDKELAQKMSANAAKLAAETFSPEHHLRRLLAVTGLTMPH